MASDSPGFVNSQWAERALLAACLSLCGSIAIFGNITVSHGQQYVHLAESFLDGKLYLDSVPQYWHDSAAYGGRYYWPLGPLPAVLIAPLVYLFRLTGATFYLGYLSLPLAFLVGWSCFRLARKCARSTEESLWLTLAFCGASSYLSVAAIPMSWPFAQVIAMFLLFLALHEWTNRQRWWWLGLLMGLTAACRISAGLNLALFAGTALMCEKGRSMKNLMMFSAGIAIPLLCLGAYNDARFDSVWETGYSYQRPARGDFSTSSLANVIPHLQIFLFGPPAKSENFPFIMTNPMGMSVLLLSPWLLYLGSLRLDRFNAVALVDCALVLLAVLAWRSTGQLQVGYRFLLDFLPVVLFMLARSGFAGGPIPLGFKVLTCAGFFSNLYFLYSLVGMLGQS